MTLSIGSNLRARMFLYGLSLWVELILEKSDTLQICFKQVRLKFYRWIPMAANSIIQSENRCIADLVRHWSAWSPWSYRHSVSHQERRRVCCSLNCTGAGVQRRIVEKISGMQRHRFSRWFVCFFSLFSLPGTRLAGIHVQWLPYGQQARLSINTPPRDARR